MKQHSRVAALLDNWRFWNGIAFVGLALVIVALWVNFDRVSHDQARTALVVSERHADVIANADAQYEQCIKSIPALGRVNLFIRAVGSIDEVLLTNSKATHSVTPMGATFKAQVKNIRRLRNAIVDVRGVSFPVPTAKACRELRTRLQEKQ